MLRTVAAFDRIGEENAFAVLARDGLATQAATSSIRHASPTSHAHHVVAAGSRRCATATTAIRPRRISLCAGGAADPF